VLLQSLLTFQTDGTSAIIGFELIHTDLPLYLVLPSGRELSYFFHYILFADYAPDSIGPPALAANNSGYYEASFYYIRFAIEDIVVGENFGTALRAV
jgi:hypothetical protein